MLLFIDNSVSDATNTDISDIMANILVKDSKMENNICTMDLDDEPCLKPVPESFDNKCDTSENVLKDVEENKDDSLLFPGSTITVSAAMVLILNFWH